MQEVRLLDLFCGAGGAAKGYHDAGFEVVGVDHVPQPHYPYEFHEADAMTYPLEGFDVIHASPPCQAYSAAMRHLSKPTPMLIDALRERLEAQPTPFVIENVPGAPMRSPLVLCGTMFGLRIVRHRLFESSLFIWPPAACNHRERSVINPHRAESRQRIYAEFGRQDPEKLWGVEMGIEWMGRYELREAIPPAYTRYIGERALEALGAAVRAR